jgi:hypothetical protein
VDYSLFIRDFLFNNGSVSLEGIGVLKTGGSSTSPVQFFYDKRALTSRELITFISERAGKNNVLVSSGIDAFLSETRQFINLGKPWEIVDVGSIQMGKNLEYFLEPKPATDDPESKRKKAISQHVLVDNYAEKKTGSGLNILVALIIIIVIAGSGYTVYNMSTENDNTIKLNTAAADSAAVVDTVTHTAVTTDTTTVKPATDSFSVNPVAKSNEKIFAATNMDSATYKFVFERTFNNQRAYSRYNQLKSYNMRVRIDSIGTDTPKLYKLFVEKKLAGKDTSAVKDSLRTYFGTPVSIEGIR